MRQITLLVVFFLLLNMSASLKAQTWNWAKNFGGSSSDKGITVKVDAAGNAIVTGYFQGTVSLGNGVTLSPVGSGKEIFIAKFDNMGVCQWAKTGGDTFDDRILGTHIDSLGNIYITGTCWYDITLGGVALTTGAITPTACCDQCFVYKLDPSGNVLWGTMAGGSGDDQGLDITTDGAGNVYVCGFTNSNGTIDFGSNLNVTCANTGTHVYNYFTAKLNSTGAWLWGTTFGNLPWDPAANKYVERDIAMSIDDNGNLYVAGGFDGTRNFGTTQLTSVGGHDVFLTQISPAGTVNWAVSGGSDEDDWANGVAADSLGNVYVTGEHRDSMYFGSVLIKNFKKRDVFIAKFQSQDGLCLWGKRAGGDEGGERGNDVYANKSCDVYVVGEVGDKAKFGPIQADSLGGPQMFAARISPDGDWLWATTGGSNDTFDIRANSVVLGKNRNLYVTGNFRQSAILGGTNLTSAGKTDVFLVQIKDDNKQVACIPPPFLDAGVLSIQSPIDTSCSNVIKPQFSLTNIGNIILTSATIEYTIDGGTPMSYNWTGNLDSLQIALVNLPTSTVTSGAHTIAITITMANGLAEASPSNNSQSQVFYCLNIVGQPLPFIEGFESATFPPQNIVLYNADGGITWEQTNTASALGNNSCRMRNISNNTIGTRDELQLPFLDWTNVNYPQLAFDVAYANYTAGASDTLEILISPDCGMSYQTLVKLFGASLLTAPANTSPFVPTIHQWKHHNYNLQAFTGNPVTKIIFRNSSGYENNLYLDNINVFASPTDIQNYDALGQQISFFPNPATDRINIAYQAPKTTNFTIELVDMTGRSIQKWQENAQIGKNEWEMKLPSVAKGMYLLRFNDGKTNFTERLSIE